MNPNRDFNDQPWRQFTDRARNVWDRLSDRDWEQVAEQPGQLVDKLREHYGWSRQEAERSIQRFLEGDETTEDTP